MNISKKYKIARRLGASIYPKTSTPRFAMVESKKKANLQKKRKHRSNTTEYGIQFLEKQKIRYTYGITEKQLSNYVGKARSGNKGAPADVAYVLLESRLDNVVYRLGIAGTRQFARQMISHGHIEVNGKRLSIPSYSVKIGDKIGVRDNSKKSNILVNRMEAIKEHNVVNWLHLDKEKLEGSVIATPIVGERESDLNFGILVQFYSRV
ncbi:MAG TPA: 30S ribosomal protein S4 [Candidatus Paceibacterota bacterium]